MSASGSDMEPQTFEPLGAAAVRALGALVEKAFTTPDNYPLSLNALTAACNQSSNRDPVMQLGEPEVAAALRELSDRSLAREVHRSDSRVKRYRHLLQDTLHLHAPEQAALCVLLLRGPQTPGEIRTRTMRMVEFIDLSHVEITLQSLATLSTPLVRQLPRLPGQKEVRYAHLLAGESQATPAATDPPPAGPAGSSPPDANAGGGRIAALEHELAELRRELAELRERFDSFRDEFR